MGREPSRELSPLPTSAKTVHPWIERICSDVHSTHGKGHSLESGSGRQRPLGSGLPVASQQLKDKEATPQLPAMIPSLDELVGQAFMTVLATQGQDPST